MTAPAQPAAEDRRQRFSVPLFAVFLALLVLAAGIVAADAAIAGKAVTATVMSNGATATQMNDCTSAAGKCYQRLLMTQVYVTQCAKNTNTDDELAACVKSRLDAAGLPVPPALAKLAAPTASPTPSKAQDAD